MKVPWLWLHVIILLVQCQRGCPHLVTNSSITDHLCNVEEAQFLLQLKQLVSTEQVLVSVESCPDIPTNYSKLMSWSPSRDCCLWDGVTCHRSTGHVIGLDLSCSSLMGNLHSNSTLFRLTHLRRLNLAYNDFSASQISFKFGQLNRLTHLNLSSSGFSGHIPVEFYHLSNLVELDISPYYFLQEISLDIKRLFGNMTKLRVALLGRVNISSELPLNMSSFLTHLDLYNTQLRGDLPASIFDKPHLQILTLSWNPGLTGSLPSFNRSNVRLMEQLDLKRTSISGRLPDSIGFMSNLKSMDLSRCKFSGHIPDSIGNLTKIRYINLRSNEYFTGQLPSTIGNLGQLTELDLSWNRLQGQLPDTFSGLQKLTALRLVRNRFTGTIPYSLTNLSRLESMYISYNELTGRIPASLTNMSKLMWLQISSNKLTGPFPATPGDGLQQLYHVDLFNNSIQGSLEKLGVSTARA